MPLAKHIPQAFSILSHPLAKTPIWRCKMLVIGVLETFKNTACFLLRIAKRWRRYGTRTSDDE
jgi:hypothetical protein